MKKFFDNLGNIIGGLFAGGFMIVYMVIMVGIVVLCFKAGFDAIHSISKTVVGIFSNEKESEKEKFVRAIKDKETAADVVCAGFEYQIQRMKKESPEQLQAFSSLKCEKIDPDHVAMNYKLGRTLNANEQTMFKMYFGKSSFDKSQDFKKICKMLSISGKKINLVNLIVELNYYAVDDELMYSTVIDKDRCQLDQYATKRDEGSEL